VCQHAGDIFKNVRAAVWKQKAANGENPRTHRDTQDNPNQPVVEIIQASVDLAGVATCPPEHHPRRGLL